MKFQSAKGIIFDTEKIAKSQTVLVLNDQGRQVMARLKPTGKQTVVEEFREKVSMIECEYDFGVIEVNEDFLFQ